MAKLPRRKCAHKACRQWFHPVRDGQVVCSFECASAIGKEQTSKAREAAQQKEAQRQRTEEKGRQRRKARLAELRPNGYYKAGSASFQRLHPCARCRFAMHQLW